MDGEDPLQNLKIETDLRRSVQSDIAHMRTIGTYKGRRYAFDAIQTSFVSRLISYSLPSLQARSGIACTRPEHTDKRQNSEEAQQGGQENILNVSGSLLMAYHLTFQIIRMTDTFCQSQITSPSNGRERYPASGATDICPHEQFEPDCQVKIRSVGAHAYDIGVYYVPGTHELDCRRESALPMLISYHHSLECLGRAGHHTQTGVLSDPSGDVVANGAMASRYTKPLPGQLFAIYIIVKFSILPVTKGMIKGRFTDMHAL